MNLCPMAALAVDVLAGAVYLVAHQIVMGAPSAPVGGGARLVVGARDLASVLAGASVLAAHYHVPGAGWSAAGWATVALLAGLALLAGARRTRARYAAQDEHAAAGRVLLGAGRLRSDPATRARLEALASDTRARVEDARRRLHAEA